MGQGLSNVTKPFNPEAHKENDAKAKKYAAGYWQSKGIEVRNNPDRYGIDQMLYKDNDLYGYCECEIKWYLEEGRFKWQTLNILYRKRKYAELEESTGKPVFFCLFSPDGDKLALTRGKDILRCTVKELSNNAVKKGELFYDVPLDMVELQEFPEAPWVDQRFRTWLKGIEGFAASDQAPSAHLFFCTGRAKHGGKL